jgi:pyruvate/2-oxoacid:ferredoxin oxidoreductase beta subunit
MKAMVIVFLDIRGVIMIECLSECTTSRSQPSSQETVEEQQHWLKAKSWTFSRQYSLAVKQILADKFIPVDTHYDYYLFTKGKSALKGKHSQSVRQNLKAAARDTGW